MITPQKLQTYSQSPAAFREDLLVDVDGSVRRFGEVMDDWQRADFAALDGGLMRCNGRSEASDAKMRGYLERGRGSSKTTDLSIIVVWALLFATRPLKGYAFAADQDQAKLLKNAVDVLIRLNPWIGEVLEVQKNSVVNKRVGHDGYGATLEVSTSDVASSYGILPDLIVADELTHWQANADQLWNSLISSAAKRSGCMLVVIANAGFEETWQWKLREAIREDEAWYFSRLDGPVASWMSEKTLAEQRRILPGKAFDRLWLNNWTSGLGDAINPEDIAAAFLPELVPQDGKEPGWLYVGGVDLGLTRDCSAFVVLAVPDKGRAGAIRLVHHKLWRPTLGQKMNLLEVESHILEADLRFGLEYIIYDPWQSEHLAQTLEADTNHRRRNQRRAYSAQPWMIELPPTAANQRQQASLMIEFFNDHRIQLYDCEPLRRDLKKLRLEEKTNGSYRLVSPRDGEGHGDTVSAFALALVKAHEVAGSRRFVLTDIGGGGKYTNHLDAWNARVAEYERQQALAQQDIDAQDDDPIGLREAMRTGGVTWSSQIIPRNMFFN